MQNWPGYGVENQMLRPRPREKRPGVCLPVSYDWYRQPRGTLCRLALRRRDYFALPSEKIRLSAFVIPESDIRSLLSRVLRRGARFSSTAASNVLTGSSHAY